MASGLPILAIGSWAGWRRRDQARPWRAFAAGTADWHLLAVLLLIALGVQFEDAHGVTTDGVIYFSQLRSVIFDRDLNVAAEFAFLGQPPRPYHVVPIGPTVVWLPLYLVVASVDAIGRSIGWWSAPSDPVGTGLTLPFVRAALVSSLAIGAVGLVVVHRHLRGQFGKWQALTATTLLFGATPLVWYMVYEPSMTHAASFGFVAMFVIAAARRTSVAMTAQDGLLLGVLLGLAFVSRPQEGVFALFPAVLLLTSPEPWAARVQTALRLALWAFAGMAPFFIAQAIHSYILFSREQFALVGADGYLDFFNSRWDDVLWSSWHGFLSWTPIAYVALVGSIAYARRSWRWAAATVLIVFVMAWVNGSTADWAAGWSFGGRRFTSCLVLLAPGLALVIDTLMRRPMVSIAVLAGAAVVWNQLLIVQLSQGLLPIGEPVTFAQVVRQQASTLTRPPYFYPFSFPANAWFAWRHGLPIDSYDLLAPERVESSFDLQFEARASRFFIGPWGPRGGDQWGPHYWMDQPRAELIVPIDLHGRSALTLEIQARTRLVEPPVPVELQVTVNGTPVGRFVPDSSAPSTGSFQVEASLWKTGFNRVVLDKSFPQPSAPPIAIYRLILR